MTKMPGSGSISQIVPKSHGSATLLNNINNHQKGARRERIFFASAVTRNSKVPLGVVVTAAVGKGGRVRASVVLAVVCLAVVAAVVVEVVVVLAVVVTGTAVVTTL